MASKLPCHRHPALGRQLSLSLKSVRFSPARRSCNIGECSTSSNPCSCGVVIVDHGSRRKASNDMLLEFCELYKQTTQRQIVEPAHMEIAEPSIRQAIARCVVQGAKHIVVAPYFLSRGRHIQEDIPALVAEAQSEFPGITCQIAEPIGIDPLMVQLINHRVQAVLSDSCPAAVAAAAAAAASPVSAAASTQQ